MKRIIFLLLMVCPALAFAQTRYPAYRDVLTKFFSLYHHENSVEEVLNFARKKEGWYVQIINPAKFDTVVSNQIFWSKQKGRYQVLENFVGANKDPIDKKVEDQIAGSFYFPYGYERCLYYGYDGWDADLIKDFEPTVANDTTLESLARAYSYYASRYSWYQYGGRPLSEDSLQIKLGRLQWPGDERVKKIVEYSDKAIAAYEKILQRNKSYETFAGNVAGKCFDECFHAYFQMVMSERPVEAENFLARCRIPTADSLLAVSYLSAMPPNAILFTFGDNDTYPLYYLQDKLNFRKDVTVVHASMLGLPAYIDLLKRKNKVHFASTPAEYGIKDFDYTFFYGQSMGKMMKLSDFIANRKNANKVPTMGPDSVRVYNEKHLYMQFPKSSDTLHIQLGEHIFMSDYIMLDIISSNLQERPIYFTNPWYMVPSGNLLKQGNVLKLSPKN